MEHLRLAAYVQECTGSTTQVRFEAPNFAESLVFLSASSATFLLNFWSHRLSPRCMHISMRAMVRFTAVKKCPRIYRAGENRPRIGLDATALAISPVVIRAPGFGWGLQEVVTMLPGNDGVSLPVLSNALYCFKGVRVRIVINQRYHPELFFKDSIHLCE